MISGRFMQKSERALRIEVQFKLINITERQPDTHAARYEQGTRRRGGGGPVTCLTPLALH